MITMTCDLCKKEIPEEDNPEDRIPYMDYLREKGEGAIIVDIGRVMKSRDEDHYWTRHFDLCKECQLKTTKLIIEALGCG